MAAENIGNVNGDANKVTKIVNELE